MILLSIAAVSLLVFPGCRRGKQQAPPPGSASNAASPESRSKAPADDDERKPSAFARLLGRDTVPGYGWDGHASSTTVSASQDVIFDSIMGALRQMGFSIKTELTKREGANVQIVGAKTDKTTALVSMAPKSGTNATELKVKVGTVGDRTGSESILDEIKEAIARARK